MAEKKLRIYVSSTTADFGEIRKKLAEQIRGLGYEPVYMGEYSAAAVAPIEKVLVDVASCDAYVGLFAFRYGEPIPGVGKSHTELEYREAKKRGIPTLIFLLDDAVEEWPVRLIDRGEKGVLMQTLREDLLKQDSHMLHPFTKLTDLLVKVPQALNDFKTRHADSTRSNHSPESRRSAPLQRISIDRLPDTSGELFGRENEIAHLDEAWRTPHTNVFCLIGFGGMGKSAIVNEWVARLATHDYGTAERVFAWSFFNQERDQQDVSTDLFVSEAFRFFGVPIEEVVLDPIEKGGRLAEVIGEKRNLLILDGLEALQHTSDGRLKDQAVLLLLKKLIAENRGLCVITSRATIPETKPWIKKTVVQLELGPLSTEAGVHLLENCGVNGRAEEIASAVREYDGHPLMLELLGGFLKVVHFGDVTRRRELDVHDEPALRLMKAHQHLLGEGPELNLARILGLYNQKKVRLDEIEPVIAPPAIPSLTDHLTGASRTDRNRAILQLRELRLLKSNERDCLEMPDVVREHFASLMLHENRDAWRKANGRLFDYYRGLPSAELPESMIEMAPLFQAVTHGCRAGRYQEAWDEVEWKRIRREDEGFCVLTLGAWQEDLVALESFFEPSNDLAERWARPVAELSKKDRAWLLTETAFNLRGLGRLEEAMRPLRAGVALHKEVGNCWAACDAAGNLSEQLILYADLAGADAAAEESIRLALEAADIGSLAEARAMSKPAPGSTALKTLKTLATNLATRAEVMHHRGRVDDSLHAYVDAEQLYTSIMPDKHYLQGSRGFHYCELLLDLGRSDEVIERSKEMEATGEQFSLMYVVGLAKIVRAKALGARFNDDAAGLSEATNAVNDGVETLRRAGQQELLLRGLLAAAGLYAVARDFDRGKTLVDDLVERTRQGNIRLLHIDALLTGARLELSRGDRCAAAEYGNRAARELKGLNYGRRASELAVLCTALAR